MSEFRLKEHPEEIQLTENQEIQQILGVPPRWILRWGILIVFLAVISLFLIGWFVKFPDTIPARVVLTTEQPPIRVYSRTEGKISELLVGDNEQVITGQIVAVMESTAGWQDILRLESFLKDPDSLFVSNELPHGLNLGNLQNSYSNLSQKLQEYNYIQNFNITTKKVKAINQQIEKLKKLNESLEDQKITLQKVAALSKSNVNRTTALLEEQVGTPLDVENAEKQYLQDQKDLEELSAQIINNEILMREMEVVILETEQLENDTKSNKSFGIQGDYRRLQSDIKQWKQNYLIKSPIDGKVSMARIWSPQQFVLANEEIMTIVPESGAGEVIGKAYLPFRGSGKVEAGARANIRLDGYPFQEFGSINGHIKSIALVPQEGGYLIEIDIPADMKTTYDRTIVFKQEMQGTANIITEDRRILERIFDRVQSLFKNR